MTGYGGDGTVGELEWAQMAAVFARDVVSISNAWAVTQGTGRQVSVAGSTGYAYAKGVLDKTAGTLTKNLSTPTNGQWFLITRRIDWSPAGTSTTIEAIAHDTTSTTLPTTPPTTMPSVNSSPGVLYDHALAWAWVRSSDTTMVLFDLRTVSDLAGGWLDSVYYPTLGNVTVGNGTLEARAFQFGDLVVVKINLVFGSTTAVSGAISVSLPAAIGGAATHAFHVSGLAVDATGSTYPVHGLRSNNTTILVRSSTVSGSAVISSAATATAPFTWTTSDQLMLMVVFLV